MGYFNDYELTHAASRTTDDDRLDRLDGIPLPQPFIGPLLPEIGENETIQNLVKDFHLSETEARAHYYGIPTPEEIPHEELMDLLDAQDYERAGWDEERMLTPGNAQDGERL